MIEEASKLLNVKEKVLKEFDTLDFFNNNNRLEGVLCIQADHRYGALVIFKVNGVETGPQVIYCTPKLHYPFSTNEETDERKFHWPKADEFHIYDKLDFLWNLLNRINHLFL